MLQLFSMTVRLVRLAASAVSANDGGEADRESWLRDPLAHPVLDHMSLGELADLPPSALRSCCRE
jgi:hypothetical protein